MTYDYECERCGTIEVEQRICDEPLSRCPLCTIGTVKRLISCSNFVLKGDCWYRDGYNSQKRD